MPRGFGGARAPHVGGSADLWLPLDTAAGGVNVLDNRNWELSFVIARGGDPRPTFSALESRVEGVLAELDPNLAPYDFVTYRELLAAHLARERFAATLMSSFAGLVLLLAALGLYGVLDYGVRRRRPELGIRLALGAARRRLLLDVVGYALAVTVAGLAVGFAVVWAGERWLSAAFDRSGLATSDLAGSDFTVSGVDPGLMIAVAVTVLAVAALAALAPARRTLAIDPAEVLKSQ